MNHNVSRRGFLAGASTTAVTGTLLANRAAPSETIRIGLIGCGGRGPGELLTEHRGECQAADARGRSAQEAATRQRHG